MPSCQLALGPQNPLQDYKIEMWIFLPFFFQEKKSPLLPDNHKYWEWTDITHARIPYAFSAFEWASGVYSIWSLIEKRQNGDGIMEADKNDIASFSWLTLSKCPRRRYSDFALRLTNVFERVKWTIHIEIFDWIIQSSGPKETMCKHLTKTNDVYVMSIKVGTPCRSVNQRNFSFPLEI